VPSASQRPHVYGDERKFKAALARSIKRAEELLDQALGVRKRVVESAAGGKPEWWTAHFVDAPWAKEVERFAVRTRKSMSEYLQEQFPKVLQLLSAPLPRPTADEPRHALVVDTLNPG
jgi:hypothetical protein